MLPWFAFFSSEEDTDIDYSWVKPTGVFNNNIKNTHMSVNHFHWTLICYSDMFIFKYFAITALAVPHVQVCLHWTQEMQESLCIFVPELALCCPRCSRRQCQDTAAAGQCWGHGWSLQETKSCSTKAQLPAESTKAYINKTLIFGF